MQVDFNLRDYLKPGGSRPYTALAHHLESALASGKEVYLWSVAGHFMVSAAPTLVEYGRPWSDSEKWYKTAEDALNKRNGKR